MHCFSQSCWGLNEIFTPACVMLAVRLGTNQALKHELLFWESILSASVWIKWGSLTRLGIDFCIWKCSLHGKTQNEYEEKWPFLFSYVRLDSLSLLQSQRLIPHPETKQDETPAWHHEFISTVIYFAEALTGKWPWVESFDQVEFWSTQQTPAVLFRRRWFDPVYVRITNRAWFTFLVLLWQISTNLEISSNTDLLFMVLQVWGPKWFP